jgi:hypothetical protein
MYLIACSRSIRTHLKVDRRRSSYFFLWAALLCLECIVGWPFVVSSAHAQGVNTIQTVAGGAVVSGAATANDIPGPSAVIEDASGNIYIAAPYSYNVFEVTPSGTISVFAGTGIKGFSGDGKPATQATLSAPAGLAIDSAGNIYIADLHRVRKVTNGIINTVAGTGKACPVSDYTSQPCGDGGPATSAQLNSPQGLVVDKSGNIYIADTGDSRIRVVNTQAATVTVVGVMIPSGDIQTVAGTDHVCGQPTMGCGNDGPALAAQLDLPVGITLDASQDIFIGDTRDQKVRCVLAVIGGCSDMSHKYQVGDIVNIAGTGKVCTNSCGDDGPAKNAELHDPSGIAFDSAGNLYIADRLDHRIREINNKAIIGTAVGSGIQGFCGDKGPPTSACLDFPYAVLVDSAGTIWVGDTGNQRVREVVSNTISTFAGGVSEGDGGLATSATLANPQSVTWDNNGNFYIADTANNRIRKVSGGTISTIAGTGSAGWSGDTRQATSATLNAPFGVAIDNSGNIFVSDSLNYVIREISPSGVISTIAGNYNVQCDPPTDLCGDGGSATGPTAAFTSPTALSVDNLGNLYIADSFGNRVRQVYLSGPNQGNITTAAGTGVPGNLGDGGPATMARVNQPTGVANDGAGNVYISDTQNNKVRCILAVLLGCGGSGLPVDDILTFAFTGKRGFFGDGGAAINAKTVTPSQVAVDPVGNVYVGGGGNSLVRRIDAATLTVDTVAGNPQHPGSAGFGGDGGPATKATLDNSGLSVNAAKSLLIADNGNNRIRQTNMVPVLTASTTSLNFPNTKVGSTSAPMSVKLTNVGADDQALGTFSITGPDPGDFAIHTNSCTAMLAPDLSCTISVVFTPQMTGARSAFLKVSNLSERLPLSGVGD